MTDRWTPVIRVRGDGAARTAPGRDAEFTAFMADVEPVLGRMAYLLTGDMHRAEELVQQTLVRTYAAWHRVRDGDPVAYARRVLANARIDAWRKRRREVLVTPADLPHDAEPAAHEQAHADRDQLVRALALLPEQRRRVVVLRYMLDLGERQVAADLGISVGAVKSAASRGLAQLRAVIDPEPAARTEDQR
ncbi:SigE family RNA polymerase sigma factor [Isoptericola sp. BMS4]|uniref:SigE family RNA polymerase sigma factor n=1 Tax=Isoptericola sp. BMS4 TaxID=2527875 RepID=UPI001F0DCEC1|nr:SigE family RNA polymerase sigma factor [Isoptericola sp. BMS4]